MPLDFQPLKPFAPLCRKPLRPRELASYVQKKEYDESVRKFDDRVHKILCDIVSCFAKFQANGFVSSDLINIRRKVDSLGMCPKNADLERELEERMEKEDQDLIKCFDDVLSMVGEDQHNLQENAATDISKLPKRTETIALDLTSEEIESHQMLEQMKVLFPSILVPWLKKCVDARLKDRWQSEKIASWIFDNLNVAPREEKTAEQTRLLATDMEAQKARIVSSVRKVDNSYIFNAKYKLCEKFNRISMESVEIVLIHCHYMYLPALIFLAENLSNYLEKTDLSWNDLYDGDVIYVEKIMTDAVTKQLKKLSIPIRICDKKRYFQTAKLHIHKVPDILRLEMNWGERYLIAIESKYNVRLKERIKSKRRERRMRQASEKGEVLECDLCMESYLPEEKVICTNNHVVCARCIRNHANEVVNGNIMLTPEGDLPCLIGKCAGVYRDNMLTNNVPDELHDQIDDRRQNEILYAVLKGTPNVVKCPFCQYIVFDETDPKLNKVLVCQHPKCKRKSCRLCKADWRDHDGKPCTEIETNQEEALRKRYEAVLSMKKIRICHRCGTPIVKNEGCNKMTCRCGAKMCYLCRAKDIDYDHFCRHPTNPGQSCSECSGCRLFEDAEKFDRKEKDNIDRQRQLDEWKLMLGVQLNDENEPKK